MANAPTPINTNMSDSSSMDGFLAMPTKFLVLCPASSSNYPYAASVSQPESPQSASATAAPIDMTKAVSVLNTSASRTAETPGSAKPEVSLDALAKARSPSVSSDRSNGSSSTSATQMPRFLKLGPVHYGHGDGADDFSYST